MITSQEFLLNESKSKVEAIMASAPGDLERLNASLPVLFPYTSLSEASVAFVKDLETATTDNPGNAAVTKALYATRDELAAAVQKIMAIERFIALSTPKMEDGNNFGVSVQMIVAKYLKETKEGLVKSLDGLPDYFDKRAGAYDKLPSVSSVTFTKSKSESKSSSKSTKGEDGDEAKSSESESQETKYSKKSDKDRVQHVVGIDVKAYFDLMTAMTSLIDNYAVAIDNLMKNFDKISAPKGSSGPNSMSMVSESNSTHRLLIVHAKFALFLSFYRDLNQLTQSAPYSSKTSPAVSMTSNHPNPFIFLNHLQLPQIGSLSTHPHPPLRAE